MIYIFDRNENLLEVITDYKEFKYIKKLNSDRTLSFEIEKNNNIKKYNKVGFFDNDKNFQLFFINDFTSFKDADTEKISVDCLADFYRLGNTLIDDKRATTIRDAVTKCLESSDYKVGTVESFEDRNINFYHISRIKALNEIINTFKCEIDIRVEINEATGEIGNKFIDFKHRLGADTGIRFTYDTALESVEKNTLEGHFNVLWGWGKSLETEAGGFSRKLDFADINNGKKYIEDTESIAKYGRLEGIFEDSKIEDKAILLKSTKERLDETKELKMSYKASIKDISKLSGYEHFKVNIGDTIVILDEEINDIIEARIIGIEENKEEENSESDIEITLGNFLLALSDDDLDDILGNLNDKIDNIPKPDIPDADTIFPDVLPKIPVVEAQGLFSSVILSWSYENKLYYTYEVFASKIKDFKPDNSNRIFEGKASSYLHEVKPDETWYYRVRGKNTYGKVTDYSNQVKATTKKIADGTQYFEELAIGHALIASLDLDKATVGKLKAQFLDVYNLVVRDGNGKITLKVDDFGRIYMDVTELKISSKSVETQDGALAKIQDAINEYNKLIDKEFDDIITAHNDLTAEMNGAFKDGLISQSEAISINERLVALEKEKEDIYKEYNTIYSNSNLNNTSEKTEILNAKSSLDIAYLELKNTILAAIEDSKIIASEITNINAKTDIYNKASATYREKFTQAIDKIGSVKSTLAETNAKNFASSEIKQTADSIVEKVESVENKTETLENGITNVEERVKKAEEKITDDAIINTVKETVNTAKNEAINSANKSTDSKLNNYTSIEKFTELKQSSEDFKFDVKQSGSRNILKDAHCELGLTYYRLEGSGGLMVYNSVIGAEHNVIGQLTGIKTVTYPVVGGRKYYISARVGSEVYPYTGTHAADTTLLIKWWNSAGNVIGNSVIFEKTTTSGWKDYNYEVKAPSDATICRFMYLGTPRKLNGYTSGTSPTHKLRMLVDWLRMSEQVGFGYVPTEAEIISNRMTVNTEMVECTFENGTKTSMGRAGFYYKTGDGQWEYHALSTVGTIRIPSEETRIITLPAVFRNKNFKVICTVSQIGNGNDAISNPKPLISFWAGSDQHNYQNGTFRLYGSTRLRNDNGSIAYKDKEVEISYTVIA